jgi:hypothetical protein
MALGLYFRDEEDYNNFEREVKLKEDQIGGIIIIEDEPFNNVRPEDIQAF